MAIVVAALRPLRLDLGLLNVALLLLLVSVVSAAAFGWVVGLYTAVLSNLAFNFFFVPPLYRLSVQQPNNALALAVFLGVAAIAAGLLARQRRSAIAARSAAATAETLLDESRRNALAAERRADETQMLLALNRTTRDLPLAAVPEAICRLVVQRFAVVACTLYRLEGDELEAVAHAGEGGPPLSRAEHSVAAQAMASDRPAGLGYHHSRSARLPGHGSSESDRLFVPVRIENAATGVLRVRTAGSPLSPEQEELLQAFAGEAGTALQRATLVASAQEAALIRERDRLRTALLTSVSHDLRTPLTAIKASAANLMSPDVQWSEAARQEFLGAIDREADRLTRLVTNLLDLSRIEAGALQLDLDWNDLEELLRNAAYRLEQNVPGRTVTVAIDPALPLLRFDYVQIDRVVANLLDNAAKYSPGDAPIELHVRVGEESVRVNVRDHGRGIPTAERRRVFDPFYRAARGGAGGSGLGLAICKGIVEAHGGRIWADGGDGAVITFTLPLAPAPAAQPDGKPATTGTGT